MFPVCGEISSVFLHPGSKLPSFRSRSRVKLIRNTSKVINQIRVRRLIDKSLQRLKLKEVEANVLKVDLKR